MITATIVFNIDWDGKPLRITDAERSKRLMRFRTRLQVAIRNRADPDIDVLIDTLPQPNGACGCVEVTGPENLPFSDEWDKRLTRIGKNAGLHLTQRRELA